MFPTFKLPLCVQDTQICWYGVEATAADHVHPSVHGFSVILQLHTLQELPQTQKQTEMQLRSDPWSTEGIVTTKI